MGPNTPSEGGCPGLRGSGNREGFLLPRKSGQDGLLHLTLNLWGLLKKWMGWTLHRPPEEVGPSPGDELVFLSSAFLGGKRAKLGMCFVIYLGLG